MNTEFSISEKWLSFFQDNGLSTYEDFFKTRKDQVLLAEEKSTSVFKMTIDGKRFFLKRKFPEKGKKLLRYLLKGKGIRNPVKQEVQNIEHLEKSGFKVMKVAAWGIRKSMGFPSTAFILSEAAEGDEFREAYKNASLKRRKLMYEELGRMTAELHNLGIDTYLRPQDVFCVFENDKLSMTMIDREEGSCKKVDYKEKRIKRILVKMLYKSVKQTGSVPLTKKEMLYFCKSYLANSKIINKNTKDFFLSLNKDLYVFMHTRKSYKPVKAVFADFS